MHKAITTLLCFFILSSSTVFSQDLTSLFDKYQSDSSFQYVSISKGLINLSSIFSEKSLAKNENFISSVEGLKVLSLHSHKMDAKALAFFVDVNTVLQSSPRFEPLLEARDKGVQTKILFRVGKKGNEILIITRSETVQHLILLTGNINKQDLLSMINAT